MEICVGCWQQWLEVQVETTPFDRITCAQCKDILGQSEIRVLATAETYQRYAAFTKRLMTPLC